MTTLDRCRTVAALRDRLAQARGAARRIALVPTMGALHEGHLRLVDAACGRADEVVVSVFVNPLQFGPREDLARYPRDLERDADLVAARGATVLFAPTVSEMYPEGSVTRVRPGPAAERWEGAVRPGHFEGVLTVVAKLFHLVGPDVAVFGRKDVQQAMLVRRMVADLDFPVDLLVVPTARDADGLALSSRNAYLSATERGEALALSRGLRAAREQWQAGERSAGRLRDTVAAVLAAGDGVVPDYIAVAEPEQLAPVALAPAGTVIAVAARVGATRLIDNTILGEDDV